MNKNPFVPQTSYTTPQTTQSEYPAYWTAQQGAYGAQWAGASRPPAEQSALYANYGYGAQWQRQQQQQQLQQLQAQYPPPPYNPPPAPPGPQPPYNPYQPAAAYPQPYVPQPVPIPAQPQHVPIPAQSQHFFQPRLPPQHIPPAKRPRFDPPKPQPPQPQFHPSQPPQPQFHAPPPPPPQFPGPSGPARPPPQRGRQGNPAPQRGIRGPPATGPRGMPPARGRPPSFVPGPAPRNPAHPPRGNFAQPRRGGSFRANRSGAGPSRPRHDPQPRKDENRRTLTDFKIVAFDIPDLAWSWGAVPPLPQPAVRPHPLPAPPHISTPPPSRIRIYFHTPVTPDDARPIPLPPPTTPSDSRKGKRKKLEDDDPDADEHRARPPPQMRTADDSDAEEHRARLPPQMRTADPDDPSPAPPAEDWLMAAIVDADADNDDPPGESPLYFPLCHSFAVESPPRGTLTLCSQGLHADVHMWTPEGTEGAQRAPESEGASQSSSAPAPAPIDDSIASSLISSVGEHERDTDVALRDTQVLDPCCVVGAIEELLGERGEAGAAEAHGGNVESHESQESLPASSPVNVHAELHESHESLPASSPANVPAELPPPPSDDIAATINGADDESQTQADDETQTQVDDEVRTQIDDETQTQVDDEVRTQADETQTQIDELDAVATQVTLHEPDLAPASPMDHLAGSPALPTDHLPEPPASPLVSTCGGSPTVSPRKPETKPNRVPSANRLSISYAGGNRRLVVDAEVVESLKLFRQEGRIEVLLNVARDGDEGLKGILVEGLSELTKSYLPLCDEPESDETVPPFSKAVLPSTITLRVHLDTARPLSEPKWAKSGDVQEWLKSMFGRMFWVAGDAAEGWEKKIHVADPDPPPTIHTILDGWAANSPAGVLNERQRFLRTHMCETDNILEILLRLVRGERATASYQSGPAISAPSLSGPLLSALAHGSAHAAQQTHVSLAVLAMFRMAVEYAEKAAGGEGGRREVEERMGEIVRCLPSHLVYKSLDGIFKEWRVEKKGR
ncbi:hypothetical protein C0992_012795 [Termitomyces sp. T32_za158]|nr:hypothetical protein C0992_012795 [Termitomyces sp. T32_za158]